jgi:hypothetical protein
MKLGGNASYRYARAKELKNEVNDLVAIGYCWMMNGYSSR